MRTFKVLEAAEQMNVSKHTVRAWLAQRRIGHVRLGRAIRIPAAEIQRLLDRGAVPALDDFRHAPEARVGRRTARG